MNSDSNNSTKSATAPEAVATSAVSSPTTSIVTTPSSLSSPALTPTSITGLKIQQHQQNQPAQQQQSSISVKLGSGLFSTKSQKGRRKISLPWFRQNSVSSPHAALSRQHTIDSPGSFRFFRQTSTNIQVASVEVSWVVSDYTATPGSNELSVTKGQQVEVIETSCPNDPDFCLVRLNTQSDDGVVHEGLVPISILKPQPGSQKSNSSSKKENETLQEQVNNRNKSDGMTSSSTKRRGFSGRKWLPQPLRKLSQGKVDKPAVERTLLKKGSEKNLRFSENKSEQDYELNTSSTSQSAQADYEAEEEITFELPPPMKPIQEPCVIANGPPVYKDLKDNTSVLTSNLSLQKLEENTPVDMSEIEQIVKEKTEQHEVKLKFLKPLDISSDKELETTSYSNDDSNDNNEGNNPESHDKSALNKRMCALKELVSTEHSYIQDLSDVVNGYIAELRNPNSDLVLPDELKTITMEKMIFSNIDSIYEFHRDQFYEALRSCSHDPTKLGRMMKRYEKKLEMYYFYCKNKPQSDHIVSKYITHFDQIRQKLGHRLDLNDLLIKPVQRITKYKLMFEEITNQTRRAGLVDEVESIDEASLVMNTVCKKANEMMVISRLQKYNGNISSQGNLLLHGQLMCIESVNHTDRNAPVVQKSRELQLFLFEQSIIFADIVGKKNQFSSPLYDYRSHIMVNKMNLLDLKNNRFTLQSTDPQRSESVSYTCWGSTAEQTQEWFQTIDKMLQSQNDFVKAIQSPIAYQRVNEERTIIKK